MLIWPAAPLVWLMSESREPLLSVTTLAETPRPAWLMVAARPAMVLFAGSTEMVCELPLPMWKVNEPLSVSFAATALEASVEVWASCCTVTVWLPAVAVVVAERSARVFVSELEPCLPERTPTGSVRALMSLESVESRLPRLEMTVSCDCSDGQLILVGRFGRLQLRHHLGDCARDVDALPAGGRTEAEADGSHAALP